MSLQSCKVDKYNFRLMLLLFNVITLALAQSDHIKRLLLFNDLLDIFLPWFIINSCIVNLFICLYNIV